MNIIPEFKPGNLVLLSDEITLKDNLNEKKGVKPMEFEVASIRTIKQAQNLFTLTLVELKQGDQQRFLTFKKVDDALDIRIYKFNGWLQPGSRKDLLDAGCQELFKVSPAEEWTDLIKLDVADVPAVWNKKYPTVFGETTEVPRRAGFAYPLFTGITEYESGNDIDCKEIIIIETNGWVEFLEGWSIDGSDYEIA